jgi:N-methylhydantoinase A
LITTKGFEDQLPLAKGRRILDEGRVVHPPSAVPRRRIIGVAERVDRDGRVLVPLEPADVVAAGRELVEGRGAEALAVSFLWSFKNPSHEDAAVDVLRQALPDVRVFSGAALNPIMREFERTSYAVLNAYVGSAFKGIDALVDELARLGLRVPVLLVHSGGGSITADEARRAPLGLAASGPAAGVAASVSLAEQSGVRDVLTCDMGGTSFDVAVISGGQPSRRTRGELMGIWTALPHVDVESISAGGGSIGWVDSRGMLRVGPPSAGAVPGPACYGKGGTEPTVTDALVVLGPPRVREDRRADRPRRARDGVGNPGDRARRHDQGGALARQRARPRRPCAHAHLVRRLRIALHARHRPHHPCVHGSGAGGRVGPLRVRRRHRRHPP